MGLRDNPRVKRIIERVQDSLPYALVERFIECDLLAQAASLSFFALISLAPLLVLLLWLTASLYPEAQEALNRPVFRRHLAAIIHGSSRSVHEQQAVHGRVQG